MYIETSAPRKPGDKAYLMSPQYPATKGKCLNFFYHMMGKDIGQLNIYVKSGPTIGQLVFNETGDQGKFWLHGRANIVSAAKYQVRSSGWSGGPSVLFGYPSGLFGLIGPVRVPIGLVREPIGPVRVPTRACSGTHRACTGFLRAYSGAHRLFGRLCQPAFLGFS